jgi:hypothetical protein
MSLLKLPVQPIRALEGVANGHVPKSLLVPVGPSGELLAPAARAFKALQFQLLAYNLWLTYTFGGTYRSFARQRDLFLSRYRPVSAALYFATPSSRRKRWHSAKAYGFDSTYWVKKLVDGKYPATAAAPGTSNHGLAIAIDVAYDSNPANGVGPADAAYIKGHPAWPVFEQLVIDFGFSFELDSEPWHIRFCAGDAVPRRVLDVESFIKQAAPVLNTPKLPAFDPVAGQFSLWPVNGNKPWLQVGAKGDAVRYLQGVIFHKAGGNIAIDGDYGPKTDARVNDVKRFFKVPESGVGPLTWKVIDFLAGQ